jgi:fructose-1,6-bisphosphatase/inositol monophosphatase family enzyme
MYFEYLLGAWDFAAASLIVEEAGGVLCNVAGHTLDPMKGSGVIAANSLGNLQRLTSIINSHNPASRP